MYVHLELPRDRQAPGAARRAMARLAPQLAPQALDDGRLLLSELVSNSVQHGQGDTVTVLIDGDRPGVLRCEVIDDGSGFIPRGRDPRAVGGWGLSLVEHVAATWGVREGSTHVWFELPTGHPA